jgi:hypothetical protein
MAVAINAADRSLSFVIRFLHLDRKSQQRVAFVQLTSDHGFTNTTKLQFRTRLLVMPHSIAR